MSSKAVAQALLSYGADIKIKNIVLELFFSAIPVIYMSKYKVIDPRDEAVVDFFFQYVKSTLTKRNEYGQIALSITKETFGKIDLADLSPSEISTLAEIAIKKSVFDAISRINKKIYLESVAHDVKKNDPDIAKVRFLDQVIDEYINVKKTNELSILGYNGYLETYYPVSYSKPMMLQGSNKFARAHDYNNATSYESGVKLCFEAYLRFDIKKAEDIITCSQELKDIDNLPAVKKILGELIKMIKTLAYGDNNPTANEVSELESVHLSPVTGISFVCSPEDFDNYYQNQVIKTLALDSAAAGLYLYNLPLFWNTLFQSVSVGVRCVLNDRKQSINIPTVIKNKGFLEKELYYKTLIGEKKIKGKTVSAFVDNFSLTMAKKEKQYPVVQSALASKAAKEFNEIDIKKVFNITQMPPSDETPVVEGLMIELLRDVDFDALIKSSLVPAMLYNLIAVIPNIERGKDLVDIMKKRGVFEGLDQAVNEMISSSRGYLLGDFPWLKGCSDLGKLL